MFQPNEQERFFLSWAFQCGYYDLQYLSEDNSFQEVFFRVAALMGAYSGEPDEYMGLLVWVLKAGAYLKGGPASCPGFR